MSRGNDLRPACAIACALVLGLAAGSARAGGEPEKAPPHFVVVTFAGGDAAGNIGRVLDIASDMLGPDFPTRSVVIAKSVCATLDQFNYPPPCPSYLPLIQKLNGAGSFSANVKAGATLKVPDIDLAQTRGVRITPQAQEISRNWSHLDAKVEFRNNADAVLSYDRVTITLPTASDEAARDLAAKVVLLDLSNVGVRAVPAAGGKVSAYSSPLSVQVKDACSAHHPFQPDFHYEDLANVSQSSERIALDHQLAARQPIPVRISMIDTAMRPGPNLSDSAGIAKDWVCVWETYTEDDHATHLAGIIGSRGKGFGFVGLASGITWDPLEWAKPDANGDLRPSAADPFGQVMGFIDDRTRQVDAPLPIFLASLSFRTATEYQGELSANGDLINVHVRTSEDPGGLIRSNRPFLVVAAGQVPAASTAQPAPKPIVLSATTPLSPQNLGDFDNVLVVTACDPCNRSNPRLMPNANIGAGDHSFVHVAAPGGSQDGPIPGWITDHSIGAAYGTSQSAAFVAGMAAKMVSYYPNAFREPRYLRRRIQATSWPLPALTVDGAPNDEAKHLAAGIVDPTLALFDPTRSWVEAGGQWSAPGLKSIAGLTFHNDGQAPVGSPSALLRIVRAVPGSDYPWTIYVSALNPDSGAQSDVITYSRLKADRPATITTCDGRSHPLDDYDDILLPSNGLGSWDCGHAP